MGNSSSLQEEREQKDSIRHHTLSPTQDYGTEYKKPPKGEYEYIYKIGDTPILSSIALDKVRGLSENPKGGKNVLMFLCINRNEDGTLNINVVMFGKSSEYIEEVEYIVKRAIVFLNNSKYGVISIVSIDDVVRTTQNAETESYHKDNVVIRPFSQGQFSETILSINQEDTAANPFTDIGFSTSDVSVLEYIVDHGICIGTVMRLSTTLIHMINKPRKVNSKRAVKSKRGGGKYPHQKDKKGFKSSKSNPTKLKQLRICVDGRLSLLFSNLLHFDHSSPFQLKGSKYQFGNSVLQEHAKLDLVRLIRRMQQKYFKSQTEIKRLDALLESVNVDKSVLLDQTSSTLYFLDKTSEGWTFNEASKIDIQEEVNKWTNEMEKTVSNLTVITSLRQVRQRGGGGDKNQSTLMRRTRKVKM